jgi:hypothetical protein
MAFLETGYAARLAQRDLMDGCDFGELLVFGDSLAEAAVMPSALSMKATNLAFAAASPIEMYYWVERAMRCPVAPKQVVLSLAANQFEKISPFFWENGARYGFLSFAQLQEISGVAREIGDRSFDAYKSRDGLTGVARNFLYGLQFPTLYFNSLVAARAVGRLDGNRKHYARTLQSRGHTNYGLGAEAPPPPEATVPGNIGVLPLHDYYFRRTIALLASRGVQMTFMSIPTLQKDKSSPLRDRDAAFQQYLSGIASRQPDFTVVPPSLRVWAIDDFVDGRHMGGASATTFSGLFDRCVIGLRTAQMRAGAIDACAM